MTKKKEEENRQKEKRGIEESGSGLTYEDGRRE